MGQTDSVVVKKLSTDQSDIDNPASKQALRDLHHFLDDPEDLKTHKIDGEPLIWPESGFRVELGGNATAPGLDDATKPVLEETEKHSLYFKENYVGKDHWTFVGGNDANPFVISLLQAEKIKSGYGYLALVRTKSDDLHFQLWARSKSEALGALQSNVAGLDQVELFEVKNPEIVKELAHMEARLLIPSYKFGVVYCKEGQTSENDMFSNTSASKEFTDFLDLLGDKIKLKGWTKYRGGLDCAENTTGSHSYFSHFNNFDIMYHVSTFLPHSAQNPQQLERKRHIGNDVVVIVFQDGPTGGFKPSTITSKFNHVYVVVQVVKDIGKVQRRANTKALQKSMAVSASAGDIRKKTSVESNSSSTTTKASKSRHGSDPKPSSSSKSRHESERPPKRLPTVEEDPESSRQVKSDDRSSSVKRSRPTREKSTRDKSLRGSKDKQDNDADEMSPKIDDKKEKHGSDGRSSSDKRTPSPVKSSIHKHGSERSSKHGSSERSSTGTPASSEARSPASATASGSPSKRSHSRSQSSSNTRSGRSQTLQGHESPPTAAELMAKTHARYNSSERPSPAKPLAASSPASNPAVDKLKKSRSKDSGSQVSSPAPTAGKESRSRGGGQKDKEDAEEDSDDYRPRSSTTGGPSRTNRTKKLHKSEPANPAHRKTYYRVAVVSKHGVRPFGPVLPPEKIWEPNEEFRTFLLTKLFNAERAAYYAPGFAQTRTRRLWLKEMLDKYTPPPKK